MFEALELRNSAHGLQCYQVAHGVAALLDSLLKISVSLSIRGFSTKKKLLARSGPDHEILKIPEVWSRPWSVKLTTCRKCALSVWISIISMCYLAYWVFDSQFQPFQTAEVVARSRSFSEAGPRKLADFDLGHKSVESGPATLTDFKDHPVLPKQLHSPGSRTSLTHCCFRSPAQPQKPSRDGRNELPTASNQFFSFLETFVSGVRPLKKSRRCCLPEFRTQAVTEACGTGLTHRAQRNWEGSMIDDFCRGWSNYCNPRRSCLPYLYLCFILRVQNNAASLIDFNMAAGGPTRLLRQECGFPRIDIAQDKFLLGIHTLGQPPPITYIERRASPANVCVCVLIESGKSVSGLH